MPDASQTAQATKLCSLRRHAEEIVEIVMRKGEAYGDSYRAFSGEVPDTAFEVAIRMKDKCKRLYTLTRAWCVDDACQDNGEPIEDTLRDMAGYALLLLAEMEAGA
jgi:hypothetical protein